jgi:hypothetical protein
MLAQPGFDGCDRDVLIVLVSLRQVHHGGDLKKTRHQGVAVIGSCPKDRLIVLSVAIGIFEGHLGFANPAQAADGLRLWESHCLTSLQQASQAGQHLFSSKEERVARVGKSPHPGVCLR